METQTEEEAMATREMILQDERPVEMLKLSASEIRADVNLIQQVLKAVMIDGVHYGTVPGCGDKPTLLKPGAEKIMTTFRLNGEPLIDDLSNDDEVRYRIRVRVTHQITKHEIGWGVGEASSNETKYKWITPVCAEEWNETAEDRRRKKWKKDKSGKGFQVLQVRANLSDVANTVLKMAKKRSLVDATLTCTAASDVFAQDIEDLPEDIAKAVAQERPLPPMPQRNTEKPAAQTPPPAAAAAADEANDSVEDPPAQRTMLDKTSAKNVTATWDKPCGICKKLIPKGTKSVWIMEGVDKGNYHVACAN